MSSCARCSADLRADWKFCIRCGAPVGAGRSRTDLATAAALAAAPPPSMPKERSDTVLPTPMNPPERFNLMAILALGLACIGGFGALVLGHIALHQIARSGERGGRIAIIATALGYLWLAVSIVLVVLFIKGSP